MIKKPWLLLPAPLAHSLSPYALRFIGMFKSYKSNKWSTKTWRGLEFKNPLGIAGGVDKTGDCLTSWWTLGVGFIEVGTVTPKAQKANPGQIIGRDNKTKALWNKMGFPNKGVAPLKKHLLKLNRKHFTPIFVNIGKNRDTALEKAYEDYIYCIKELSPQADAFVLNISSPNTKNLRQLFEPQHFKNFLKPILDYNQSLAELNTANKATPVLLKLSPDINNQDLQNILSVSLELGVDGWILTNTTTERKAPNDFPTEGGVSGQPLAEKSKTFLKNSLDFLSDKRTDQLVVSCGGVMSEKDVFERLDIGADLVQIYSALIFEGPSFFNSTANKALKR